MAQQVEHVLGKDEVTGSNPVSSSTKNHKVLWFFLYFYALKHKCKNCPFAKLPPFANQNGFFVNAICKFRGAIQKRRKSV